MIQREIHGVTRGSQTAEGDLSAERGRLMMIGEPTGLGLQTIETTASVERQGLQSVIPVVIVPHMAPIECPEGMAIHIIGVLIILIGRLLEADLITTGLEILGAVTPGLIVSPEIETI